MSIDIAEAIKTIDEFISELDTLLKKSYREGTDRKRELDATIQNFVRAVFPDGEKKLEDYRRSVHFYFGVVGYEETEEEKQEDYVSRLKSMRNHLVAYKKELQLRLTSRKKSSRLDEIERETQIREAEARRRAVVVEGKLWGAVIELIDMQRDELKKRGELNQEIIELRKGVRDLKSMFIELNKTLQRLVSKKD